MAKDEPLGDPRQRIDKWLFFARIVKSRSLAQLAVESGAVRINGTQCSQASHMVRSGDRVEIALERRDLLLVVRNTGERRGPFEEARQLYDDLSVPTDQQKRLSPFERSQRVLRPRDRGGS